MKSLVLAEKPSVAREIARVLDCKQKHQHYIEGSHHIITWALGHLIELKMPEDYDPSYRTWKMEDLPILPNHMGLKVISKTRPQFHAIEQLAKRRDIKELIIATDAGREGELVARWIIEKIHWKKPIQRLWISSQTDGAIHTGFKQLKPSQNYDKLYASAVCRAEADWMIGLNVTRALTTKYNDPLSAGRVQTPTLAMILEQEQHIQRFNPKEYWKITAMIGSLKTEWHNNKGEKRIFNEDRAQTILEKIKDKQAIIQSVTKKEKQENQPLPYDLTGLQQDANKRFGFSAKRTLNLLQTLYERYKLVTYPRTDSRYLTQDMEATMLERLKSISSAYKADVAPALKSKGKVLANKVFNNSKVTDHHAIIPTEETLFINDLASDERKIYDLIVRRFLALFYSAYRYETVQTTFTVEGEIFLAHDTFIKDPGFKTVVEKSQSMIKQSSLSLHKGSVFPVKAAQVEKKLTEPPQRLSEADLLEKMEKYSLGTPATRADIIEKLLQSQSIDRQNGRLFPTPKGKQLIELVNDDLKSPELTSQWEKQLEDIAKGNGNPQAFKKNIRTRAEFLVSEIKQSEQSYKAHNITGSKCPECSSFLKEIKGKDGKILICSSQECHYRRRKEPKLSQKRCSQCHKRIEIHNGQAGLYFQCKHCNNVEKADDKKKKISKREERQLLNKYNKKDELFNNPLADALKSALKESSDK